MTKGFVSGSVLAGLLFAAAPAAAQGLEGLHSQRMEGGRLCFSEHTHVGTGSGSTRQAAEREAAGSWTGFTDLEYGGLWASYRLSASKTMSCSQAGGTWSCTTESRPCRPAGGGGAARRRPAKS